MCHESMVLCGCGWHDVSFPLQIQTVSPSPHLRPGSVLFNDQPGVAGLGLLPAVRHGHLTVLRLGTEPVHHPYLHGDEDEDDDLGDLDEPALRHDPVVPAGGEFAQLEVLPCLGNVGNSCRGRREEIETSWSTRSFRFLSYIFQVPHSLMPNLGQDMRSLASSPSYT